MLKTQSEIIRKLFPMAKYGKAAQKKVAKVLHEFKEGKLKSGRSGAKVKSRKQAIAIGLSEARAKGAKVPKAKSGSKKSTGTKSTSRSSATKAKSSSSRSTSTSRKSKSSKK